jgi:ferredoxin
VTPRKEFIVTIELTVDFDRCDANGTCAALMPDVFQIRSDGLLGLLASEVDAGREGELEEAILCCPVGAISRA